MDSPSAATQLQHGTIKKLTLQLQAAASCFGLKTLKAARLDASTTCAMRKKEMIDIVHNIPNIHETTCHSVVHFSMVALVDIVSYVSRRVLQR